LCARECPSPDPLDAGGTALAGPYQVLLELRPTQRRLNVDETGHKENGKGLWTWCFRAELYTLFKIDPSRGSDVLVEVLGKEFDGVLGGDYFSTYRKYMEDFSVAVQFCLAHTTPGVEPTNNLAEQAMRFLVLDRRITQGTRGERGRQWCERIWTVIAALTQQGRSILAYLRDALHGYFRNQPASALLPTRP
jgi:hypothetical protein